MFISFMSLLREAFLDGHDSMNMPSLGRSYHGIAESIG